MFHVEHAKLSLTLRRLDWRTNRRPGPRETNRWIAMGTLDTDFTGQSDQFH